MSDFPYKFIKIKILASLLSKISPLLHRVGEKMSCFSRYIWLPYFISENLLHKLIDYHNTILDYKCSNLVNEMHTIIYEVHTITADISKKLA